MSKKLLNSDENHLPSEILSEFLNKNPRETTLVKDMLAKFKENGFIITLIFFSLPAIIPLPPGGTFIVALPIMLLSYQMLLGYDKVKLPKILSDIKLKNTTIIKIAHKAIPTLKIIESFLKPRLPIVYIILPTKAISMIAFICSISIMNPLPFSHSLPAFAIITMSIGLLKKDGLVTLFGVIIAFCGIIISILSVTTLWYLIKLIL